MARVECHSIEQQFSTFFAIYSAAPCLCCFGTPTLTIIPSLERLVLSLRRAAPSAPSLSVSALCVSAVNIFPQQKLRLPLNNVILKLSHNPVPHPLIQFPRPRIE